MVRLITIRIEPMSVAAFSHPKPIGPTCKISFAYTGTIATAPPNNTAKRSSVSAANTSFVLKTYFNPSLTASSVFFSVLMPGGFSFSFDKKNKPVKIKVMMTMNVPVMWNQAIKKPAAAWPVILAINQLVELNCEAVINKGFGTSEAMMALKLGPEKDRMQPVKKMMV